MSHLRGSQYYTRQCLLRQTADAFTSGCQRRDLPWELGGLIYQEERLDIEVPLELVTLPALGQALTSEHIRALYFPTKAGRTHGQMRLKLLFHHSYLFRDEQPTRLTEGRRPLVYFLDQKGAALLRERGLWQEEIDWRPEHNRVGSSFIEHPLRTNDVRVAMVVAAKKGGFTIRKWLDDGTLKRRQMKDYVTFTGPQGARLKAAVIPDGYFILRTAEYDSHHFLEVDLRTVTGQSGRWGRRDWDRKVRAYLAYYHSGQYEKRYGTTKGRVLTVTTGERRLENLKTITEKAGGKLRFWFSTFEQFTPEAVLTQPIWQVAAREGRHTLMR